MKRIIPLAALVAVVTVVAAISNSCKKSSSGNNGSNNGLATQPAAQAAYDDQSGGVYKGTLTGSSGYFEINLQAGKPFLIYQWTNPASGIDSLFTTSLSGWQSGQAITKAVFTGADGSVFWFSVAANGGSPSIDSVFIPSHSGPVYAAVVKELSGALVKIFAGTATPVSSDGGQCVSGTVNAWLTGNSAIITYLGTNGDQGGFTGTVSGNTLQVTGGGNNSESGTLSISANGNTITGTVSGNSCTHNVTLTRTF
jgi:hypothetical protein